MTTPESPAPQPADDGSPAGPLPDFCAKMLADAEHALRCAERYVAAHEQWERVFNAATVAFGLTEAESAADDELRDASSDLDDVSAESLATNVTALVTRLRTAEAENEAWTRKLVEHREENARLREALKQLSWRHGWIPQGGPCVCNEHVRAAELLAAGGEPMSESQEPACELVSVDRGEREGERMRERFGVTDSELRVALGPLFLLMRKSGMARIVVDRTGNHVATEVS